MPAELIAVLLTKHRNKSYLKNWSEKRPCSIKFIISDEQPLVAIDHIQNEPFISIRKHIGVSRLVREIELSDVQVQAQAWHLIVDLEVDRLIWLYADDLQAGSLYFDTSWLDCEQVSSHQGRHLLGSRRHCQIGP